MKVRKVVSPTFAHDLNDIPRCGGRGINHLQGSLSSIVVPWSIWARTTECLWYSAVRQAWSNLSTSASYTSRKCQRGVAENPVEESLLNTAPLNFSSIFHEIDPVKDLLSQNLLRPISDLLKRHTSKADPGLRLVGFILSAVAVEDEIHRSTIECDVFLL